MAFAVDDSWLSHRSPRPSGKSVLSLLVGSRPRVRAQRIGELRPLRLLALDVGERRVRDPARRVELERAAQRRHRVVRPSSRVAYQLPRRAHHADATFGSCCSLAISDAYDNQFGPCAVADGEPLGELCRIVVARRDLATPW